MDSGVWKEIIGYLASAAVVFSLTMKSILRLRLIGLVGSVSFLAYGILIGSVPIAITNVVIIAIHLYFLRKLFGRNELFEILRVRPDSLYLLRFLEFHADEIARSQPGFVYSRNPTCLPVFILRDMVPAGLLIALPHDDSVEIRLDYATPQYRDFKLGSFIYSGKSAVFGDANRVWSEPWGPVQTSYLKRMGFSTAERGGRRVLERLLG